MHMRDMQIFIAILAIMSSQNMQGQYPANDSLYRAEKLENFLQQTPIPCMRECVPIRLREIPEWWAIDNAIIPCQKECDSSKVRKLP